MPDNPSTEIALIHLIRDEMVQFRDRMHRLEQQYHRQHTELMTAIETLTASITANTNGQAELTTAVNAAVIELMSDTPSDAILLSLATAIDANTANAATLKQALDNAVNPPVIPPPVA